MGEFENKPAAGMTYPQKGTLNRLLFKLPLFLWRSGLGPILSHPRMGGSRMLAITTLGRKSGLPRHTMLSCARVDGKDYVCSGWGERSDWVQNIINDPLVTIQLGRNSYYARVYRVEELDEFTTVAEEMFQTGGDSHFEPWLESFGIDNNIDDMISKRDRLHIFGFDPLEGVGPKPLPADLRWIWLIPIAVALGIWAVFLYLT